TIQHALASLGYSAIRDVRQGKFFVLELDGTSRDDVQKQVERIAKEVLANPVIEEFRFEILDGRASVLLVSWQTAPTGRAGAASGRLYRSVCVGEIRSQSLSFDRASVLL